MVYPYTGILLNRTEERNSDAHCNMENPENITLIEPSQAQKDKLSDFTYMAYLEESVSERNQNGGPSACQWRNLGKVGLTV